MSRLGPLDYAGFGIGLATGFALIEECIRFEIEARDRERQPERVRHDGFEDERRHIIELRDALREQTAELRSLLPAPDGDFVKAARSGVARGLAGLDQDFAAIAESERGAS